LYIPEQHSYQRVKLKGRNDTEGVIVGYHLNDKDPNVLKSLIVRMDSGVQTRIGIGFTNVERKNYKKLFPLGKLAKFSFRELTQSGQPKQSRFIAIRQDLG
jgi:ATP-dependent DNA ligase